MIIIKMDRINIYLQDGYVLDAKVYAKHEKRNSFIFGDSEKISTSLKKMPYNQIVSLKYYIRNNNAVKEEPIKISVGKLMEIIGRDYIALGPPQIYFVNSIDGLFDGLER